MAAPLAIAATQASATTQSVTATATVVAPIVLSQTTPFNFGSIVPGATAGTVVLSTAGGRTTSGGTLLGNGTTPTAAVIHLTGSGTSTYSVAFSSTAQLTGPAVGNIMTVATYVVKQTAGVDQTSAYNGALVAGAQDFSIGATLSVNTAANNPAGTYSTGNASGVPLTVTVLYN